MTDQPQDAPPRIDNGNIFIFCDAVDPNQGHCLRGAGHNGDHIWKRSFRPVLLPNDAEQDLARLQAENDQLTKALTDNQLASIQRFEDLVSLRRQVQAVTQEMQTWLEDNRRDERASWDEVKQWSDQLSRVPAPQQEPT